MIIGVDFDGTCVTHEFPKVGMDIGAAPVLKDLVAAGHRLILFTMRSDVKDPKKGSNGGEILEVPGQYLTDAIKWFTQNDIPLFGINENPEQHTWTSSPKPYCHVYIDDAALGCPLITRSDPKHKGGRDFVDWYAIKGWFLKRGLV